MTTNEISDPHRALSGFLTETTRRVRRTLLAVATIGIGTNAFDVHLKSLSLLGNTVEIRNEQWLPISLFVGIAYFSVLFIVYALGDAHRTRDQTWDIYRMASTLTPGDSLRYRYSRSASVLMALRVTVDILLPVLYGIFGLMAAHPLIRSGGGS